MLNICRTEKIILANFCSIWRQTLEMSTTCSWLLLHLHVVRLTSVWRRRRREGGGGLQRRRFHTKYWRRRGISSLFLPGMLWLIFDHSCSSHAMDEKRPKTLIYVSYLAGVAFEGSPDNSVSNCQIKIIKQTGKVAALEKLVLGEYNKNRPLSSFSAISFLNLIRPVYLSAKCCHSHATFNS